MKKPEKSKKKPFEFDPDVFKPLPKASFLQRYILSPGGSILRRVLWALVFLYPLLIVMVGVVYGGLVFWASFAGSGALIYILIRKAGYARNFESWNVGYQRFLALFAAFAMSLALIYVLLYSPFHGLTVPLFAGLLVLSGILIFWRSKR